MDWKKDLLSFLLRGKSENVILKKCRKGMSLFLRKGFLEVKMYEHHFYKADWEELDRLNEAV